MYVSGLGWVLGPGNQRMPVAEGGRLRGTYCGSGRGSRPPAERTDAFHCGRVQQHPPPPPPKLHPPVSRLRHALRLAEDLPGQQREGEKRGGEGGCENSAPYSYARASPSRQLMQVLQAPRRMRTSTSVLYNAPAGSATLALSGPLRYLLFSGGACCLLLPIRLGWLQNARLSSAYEPSSYADAYAPGVLGAMAIPAKALPTTPKFSNLLGRDATGASRHVSPNQTRAKLQRSTARERR